MPVTFLFADGQQSLLGVSRTRAAGRKHPCENHRRKLEHNEKSPHETFYYLRDFGSARARPSNP